MKLGSIARLSLTLHQQEQKDEILIIRLDRFALNKEQPYGSLYLLIELQLEELYGLLEKLVQFTKAQVSLELYMNISKERKPIRTAK